MWAASLDATPSEDVPTVEDYQIGYMDRGKRVETDYSADYRQYYRDLLEAAFEADDRFRQGKVFWVKLI